MKTQDIKTLIIIAPILLQKKWKIYIIILPKKGTDALENHTHWH